MNGAHASHDPFAAARRLAEADHADRVDGGHVVPLDPGARGVYVKPLRDYRLEATDWLWKDRIPAGELTVIAGDGGLGKSTFAAWLAGQVTTGRMVGITGTRKVAVVLAEDHPARTLAPRYRAAGAAMDNIAILSGGTYQHEEPMQLPGDLELLAAVIAQDRPELLIVDPVGALLDGGTDAHRDGGRGGMRAVLNPLSRIAQEHGTTILAVFHLNKGSGPAAQRIGGSAGIRNAARNVLVFAQHPDARQNGDDDGRRVVGHDKSNYGPTQPSLDATIAAAPVLDDQGTPVLNRDGEAATTSLLTVGTESLVDYTDALRAASADGSDDEGRDALAEAVAFLRIELADGPVASRKLKAAAADAGVSDRTLKRARDQLGVKAAKSAGGWTVSLPDPLGPLGPLGGSPVTDGDRADAKPGAAGKGANAATSGPLGPLGPLGLDDDGWTTPA